MRLSILGICLTTTDSGVNFDIELAGGATLQGSHVPLCTLLSFGRLPRLTAKIYP